MGNHSRDLRDKVVRGLAKVGLVWALAVLAIGAARGEREPEPTPAAAEQPTVDLSLALGLGLFA